MTTCNFLFERATEHNLNLNAKILQRGQAGFVYLFSYWLPAIRHAALTSTRRKHEHAKSHTIVLETTCIVSSR